jgi:hypothetical protein
MCWSQENWLLCPLWVVAALESGQREATGKYSWGGSLLSPTYLPLPADLELGSKATGTSVTQQCPALPAGESSSELEFSPMADP